MTRPLRFRAAILEHSRSPLVVSEIVADPALAPGQVLVRIRFSGICGAQINEIDAVKGPDRFLPHLLGHEGYGEVIDIGPAVRNVKRGDMVVLHWMQGPGIQSETPVYRRGDERINAGWVTTFSEMAVVSENRCTPVTSTLPETVLPLFGCAATTAAGVVGREAQVRLGDSVVVLGTGGVGLLTVMAARASGAHPIIGVDIVRSRLDAAAKAGAATVLDATQEDDLLGRIREAAGGAPDVIIETSGARPMIELSYELAQPAGRAILVGVPRVDEPATIETLPLHFGMVFTGSKGGSTQPAIDIPRLVRMAEIERFPVSQLPATVFPLSDVNEAVDAARRSHNGRIVLDCRNSLGA
jgi:S-(hydroxymethyl)glutathione dehydrogenase/alcohol dehydrogenase